MSKYTIDIYTLLKDKKFQIFNFEYDFYTDNDIIKKKFEQKFIDRYMFNEIGFETVARFKHYLKTTLNEIAPHYKQLYESEMRAKDIDFLLNKDYTETFTKDTLSNMTLEGSNISDFIEGGKNSDIADGVSDVSLTKGNLTSVNENISNSTGSSSSNTEGNKNENYTLTGKGNIGITSSAELLEKWREVMINIDKMILDELSDLFMLVY